VTLEPAKDNTLFESPSNFSGGGSQWLYTGETNTNDARRALVAFDLVLIPAGSRIEQVSLTLHGAKSRVAQTDVSLHRLLADWGEEDTEEGQGGGGGGGGGALALPGDATWLRARLNRVSISGVELSGSSMTV